MARGKVEQKSFSSCPPPKKKSCVSEKITFVASPATICPVPSLPQVQVYYFRVLLEAHLCMGWGLCTYGGSFFRDSFLIHGESSVVALFSH